MDRFPGISLRAINATAMVMTVLATSAVAGDVDGDYRGTRFQGGPYAGDYRGSYNGYGYNLFGLGLGAGLGSFRHGLGGYGDRAGIGYGYGGYGNGYGSGFGYGTPAGYGNNTGHALTARAKQA